MAPPPPPPVVGCWLLVVGCWLLVVGCWLLVVGCWLLVVICCCLEYHAYPKLPRLFSTTIKTHDIGMTAVTQNFNLLLDLCCPFIFRSKQYCFDGNDLLCCFVLCFVDTTVGAASVHWVLVLVDQCTLSLHACMHACEMLRVCSLATTYPSPSFLINRNESDASDQFRSAST
jgi:hypothetical protein